MAKDFRPVLRDQSMLLPVDMREWLPPDHLVWFVLETVEVLDTSGLERATRRRGGAGAAGYDPRMLLALLVYAYCQGVRSSRQVERMCVTDVAFRVLCAQDGPDHATIARFRADAQEVFSDLFAQVLVIAAKAGLGRLGTVAIDGTKIAANASIDANRGKDWFDREVADMVAEAGRVDDAEDASSRSGDGEDRSDRVPSRMGDRTRRNERIRQAAQELQVQQRQRDRADEEHEAAALARLRRSEAGSLSLAASRMGRTGWPRRVRTWSGRSLSIRRSWIAMQPSSRRARSRWSTAGADGEQHQDRAGSACSTQR